MTKEEFIQQYKAKRPSLRRPLIVVSLAWGIVILLIVCGIPMLKRWEDTASFDWAASFDGYWIVGFFGFCLLFLRFAWGPASKPQGGVDCPACGTRLWGASAQIALFVGNCGYCGETVVTDPQVKKNLKAP